MRSPTEMDFPQSSNGGNENPFNIGLIPLDQIDSKRIDIFGTGMPRKGDLKADDSL